MNILTYIRPWNKDFYEKITPLAFHGCETIEYSDYKRFGSVWTGNYIYSDKYDELNSYYKEVKDEILFRCRYLRSLDKKTSDQLANRVWNGLSELFNTNTIDLAFIPLIDNYVLDIIERIARQNDVPVLSIVQNFIRGYSRFTVRGELVKINRSISKDEVDGVYEMLTANQYKPNFSLMKEKNNRQLAIAYYRRRLIENLYYPIHMILENDKYNYMYNYSMFDGKATDYIGKDIYKYFVMIDDVDIQEDSLYIPLHYSPESTVDYWSEHKEDAYYEKSVLRLIETINDRFPIILKEHPSMVGWRHKGFYEKILGYANVCIVHPYESSNRLLDMVRNVVVYTGSVGVEALLRGKNVIALTRNYYSDLHPNIAVGNTITDEIVHRDVVLYDGHIFIQDLLKGLFRYNFSGGRYMQEQIQTCEELVPWIKLWYEGQK